MRRLWGLASSNSSAGEAALTCILLSWCILLCRDDVILDYCVWREAHGWGEPGSSTAAPRPGAVVPTFVHAPGFASYPFAHLNETAFIHCRGLACRRPVRHRFNRARPEVAVTAHYVHGNYMARFTDALYSRSEEELDEHCAPDLLPEGCAHEAREIAAPSEIFPEALPPNSSWMGLCG